MSTAVPNNGAAQGATSSKVTTTTTTTTATTPARTDNPFTDISSSRKNTNSFMGGLMWFCMILALIPLLWLLITVISRGAPAIFDAGWWTSDMVGVRATKAGGGAAHAIVGTLVQTLIASLFAIPIGIFTAIYLVEYSNGNRLGKLTTFMVDILSGVPSIVAALFIYCLLYTSDAADE